MGKDNIVNIPICSAPKVHVNYSPDDLFLKNICKLRVLDRSVVHEALLFTFVFIGILLERDFD